MPLDLKQFIRSIPDFPQAGNFRRRLADAIEAFLDARADKKRQIEAAVAEADKGVFISQGKMSAWIDSWGTDAELPPPEPDVFPAAQ